MNPVLAAVLSIAIFILAQWQRRKSEEEERQKEWKEDEFDGRTIEEYEALMDEERRK